MCTSVVNIPLFGKPKAAWQILTIMSESGAVNIYFVILKSMNAAPTWANHLSCTFCLLIDQDWEQGNEYHSLSTKNIIKGGYNFLVWGGHNTSGNDNFNKMFPSVRFRVSNAHLDLQHYSLPLHAPQTP